MGYPNFLRFMICHLILDNPTLGEGDVVRLESNCLDSSTGSYHSRQLEALLVRGVDVAVWNQGEDSCFELEALMVDQSRKN